MIGLAPNKLEEATEDTILFTDALGVNKFSINVPDNRITFGAKDPLYNTNVVIHTIKQDSPYW